LQHELILLLLHGQRGGFEGTAHNLIEIKPV
jgi:hypothetical protein